MLHHIHRHEGALQYDMVDVNCCIDARFKLLGLPWESVSAPKFGLSGTAINRQQVQIIICKFESINCCRVFRATMKSQYGAVTMENYRHIGAGPPADTRYSDYRYRPEH